MGNAQWALELALVLLLAATLFHALRLERALGVLKRDRSVLEELVAGFNESTRQAEAGVQRLRAASEGAGRQIARQIEQAQKLRDDLQFLAERGERSAERLEGGIRSARMMTDHAAMAFPALPPSAPSFSSPPLSPTSSPVFSPPPASATSMLRPVEVPRYVPEPDMAGSARLRSEAERDLLRALRAAR
jgi:hypothetical protein